MPKEDVAQEVKIRWGAAVKQRRGECGLLQDQLAEKAGIDQGFLSTIETGKHMPSLTTRIALAKALDTTHDSLFSVDEVVR